MGNDLSARNSAALIQKLLRISVIDRLCLQTYMYTYL